MLIRNITLNKKTAQGIEIPLPKTTLVMIVGSKGYLMCGYLNTDVAERFGDSAAIISGIKNIDEMLIAKVVKVTQKAKKLGIKLGMTGKTALSKIL